MLSVMAPVNFCLACVAVSAAIIKRLKIRGFITVPSPDLNDARLRLVLQMQPESETGLGAGLYPTGKRNRTQEAQSGHKKHKKDASHFLCLLCSDLCFLCSVPVSLGKAGAGGSCGRP